MIEVILCILSIIGTISVTVAMANIGKAHNKTN
ncbi:hypothetical protein SAMN05421842_10391 [Clostridium uliginosum]|uniref:Uncharacterized protein n=1 Tax=Clostridium uliginosum TaxID=119641 RepID=A0A1I1IX29_9CLOT|nr:hypothetical protein SAMN05421842_10391 [Clostridium uliginosum]